MLILAEIMLIPARINIAPNHIFCLNHTMYCCDRTIYGSKRDRAILRYCCDRAQNWGSLLHGVLPNKHNLKNDIVENSQYPSIYKLLALDNKDIKMASYVAWEPINLRIIEKSVKVGCYAPLTHENILTRSWLHFKHKWRASL